MPSVGMRRTTRVFGVVKGADGARVLRSGRRLWLEPSDGKLKKGGEKDDWYSFVDSKGSSKQTEWTKNVNPKQEIDKADIGDGGDQKLSGDKTVAVLEGGKDVQDKMFGTVYSRKRRKRKASDVRDLDEKKYGIHFSRRTKRKKVKDINSEACFGFRGLAVVIRSASCGDDSGFSGLLYTLLRYMKRVGLKMSELSGFILEDPICEVYASRGVHFMQDPSSTFGSGICKFYGCRDYIPMFWVNFSAIPLCFTSIHIDIFLKHCSMLSARIDNFIDQQVNSDDEGELLGVQTFSLASNPEPKPDVEMPGASPLLHQPLRNLKLDGRSAQLRHGLNSRGIRKRRSCLKSIRARNSSLTGLNKNCGALASDIFSAKRNGFPFSSIVSCREVRRSGRRKPAQDVKDISSTNTTGISSSTKLVLSRDIDSTSCSVNLLIIESDKCFREEGATVLLEPSASGEWFLVVKRDGLTQYTHKADEVMKPSVLNQFTHTTVWSGDNGWRLEFLNKDDWFKFKDLYKECFDRNKQVSSATSTAAAAAKVIPVPGVREVSDYADDNLSTFFSRPNSYIIMSSDEVSRVMMKRTANYDMDCEDEEWLRRFNSGQQPSENQLGEDLKEENFELMIDAFEKAFYYNTHDISNEKPSSSLFMDMGRREVIEAVYSYWMKKRKRKRSSLIRALQVNPLRKAPVFPRPALRKKRSFKRQASHRGRGKQLDLIKALAAEREGPEAKASASQSLKVAVSKRERAQFLMKNADLAAYRATMALRIAVAAEVLESSDGAATHFLD